jgi:hypothetical protein
VLPSSHRNSKDFPDHEDANLVLRVYELRQEPVLRESRSKLTAPTFQPKSLEELMELVGPGAPLNAAFRQVHTYWEMVYNFCRHGIVHMDFFLESNNGEGLFLYAKVQPFLAGVRERIGPRSFVNAEWVTQHSEFGKALHARYAERVAQALAGR